MNVIPVYEITIKVFYSIIPCGRYVCASQEEDGKTVMEKERQKDALKTKLQRLQECILKTRKEKEGAFFFFLFFLNFRFKLYRLI